MNKIYCDKCEANVETKSVDKNICQCNQCGKPYLSKKTKNIVFLLPYFFALISVAALFSNMEITRLEGVVADLEQKIEKCSK